jgi:type IV pilus assembly protein PilB
MKENRAKIGEILVEAGLIDEMQLIAALGEQKQWGGRLCSIIINMGFADEESISAALGIQLKQQCISFDDIEIPPDILKRVSLETARKYNIIPVELKNNVLTIAISDPLDLNIIDELTFRLGLMIKPVLAIDSSIKKAISRFYEGVSNKSQISKSKTSNRPEDLDIMNADIAPPHLLFTEEVLHQKEDEIAPGIMVKALAGILIEKGLFTKEELMNKIKEKS